MSEACIPQPRRFRSEAEKREIIASQSASGKTIVEFCREAGIATSCFHKWRRTLSVSRPVRENARPVFVELTTPPLRQSVPIRVVLVTGDSIVASTDSAPEWLARLARLLKGESC